MTIDFRRPSQSKSLIRDSRPRFFPMRIPLQHKQLKHHISTRIADTIYYVSENEIYAFDLPTRKRKLVKSLSWKPSCLDAGYSWICVGGSQGRCAFIAVGDALATDRYAEVDDLLPLNLDPDSRRGYHETEWSVPRPRPTHYELHEKVLGSEIVNSVTVHLLPGGQKGLDDEVVAITTNNDQAVRMFSLTRFLTIAEIAYPLKMNHATISPDGNLMMAGGDDNPKEPQSQVFFHRRVQVAIHVEGVREAVPSYEWQAIAESKIGGGCFTTAFSPTGHVCAAASQDGCTTIFDTSLIVDDMELDSATIAVLPSSRGVTPTGQNEGFPGSIRSMNFSPAPWDLFAWAEEQGRVCVVDLRNAIESMQTLSLDPFLSMNVTVDLEEQESSLEQRQLEIERRFLDSHIESQDRLASVSHTADYMEHAAERRRRERDIPSQEFQPFREASDSLRESERQLLSQLRGHALDEVEPPRPTSVNYTSSSNGTATDRQPSPWLTSTTLSSTLQSRSTASIAEYMRLRNLEHSRTTDRTTDRTYQPRRRSSVVISNSNSNSQTANSSQDSNQTSNLTPIGTVTPTMSTSPSRLASRTPPDAAAEEPWHTITAAMHHDNALARLRRMDPNAAALRGMERRLNSSQREPSLTHGQLLQMERQRMNQLLAMRDRQRSLNTSNMQRLRQMNMVMGNRDAYNEDIVRRPRTSEDGVYTMGIGWSPDGKYLYVASEEGIFEYDVNIERRMQFPGKSWV